ncbi:caspase family protein [Rhizobacter sp. Root1221]|uniref:caspase family protein n=1 Tax=Rhizobacter sp. Root1221 TaxID=1736433 RepID=UPI0006F92600|nr:caspase family protein [Rhizobacter sp. Root1221]KQV87965.1 hypothetical protein ASC87_29040 [Rhizobacter sp. Root1221]
MKAAFLPIGLRCRRLGAIVALLCCALTWPAAFAQPARGIATTEERLALVIGNAAYRTDPLDNPINDARLVASSLQRAGFNVTVRENLDRTALLGALREFGNRLNENTIAVLYYAGHGLQLRDRNYLIPVDAEIRSEDEIPISGIDLSFILGRMSAARSRINIVILDACRNNPFAGKTVAAPRGLAQMDAPVGTLLAFATAPGKLAADSGTGTSANSLYALYLSKHLLTPGLPVESVFKRVREGVVKDTQQQQVPWESSSLQGEFAFVPGVAAAAREPAPDQEAAGELAFWNSIQASNRADEYRAYLRQYPNGRFAMLAQTRIAALAPAPPAPPAAAPASQVAPAAPQAARPELLPRPGDTWRYRVQDQFRLGDLYVTARVNAVTDEGVAETWTTTSDAQVRTALAPRSLGFHALPDWTLAPPEFAPYLQASGLLRAGQVIVDQQRRIGQVLVPMKVSVEGEEDVTVAAGRFRATKLVLRGQGVQTRGGTRSAVLTEQIVWYAPEVKRIVKQTISTRVGNVLREASSFELMEAKLN